MQSKKFLVLMAALAVGSASAQQNRAGDTLAGTTITNVASVSYTDPRDNSTQTLQSNPVNTVVNPLPNFTIVANGTQDNPGQEQAGKTPGSTVEFPYTVTNTGNTPIVVELGTTDRTDTDVQNVQYYVVDAAGNRTLLTDTDGDGLVELPEMAPDAALSIIQTYVIPATATSTQVFGANPVGTAVYDNDATDGVTVGALGSNPDQAAVLVPGTTTVLTDNDNFNRVTLITPDVDTTPATDPTNPDGNPDTPAQDGRVVVPPTSGTPGDDTPGNGTPTSPVTPTSPEDGTTDAPSQPGYDDPNGVNIAIVGDQQIAYPPADSNTTPDTVTFNNVVRNDSTIPDQVTLFPPTVTGDPQASAEITGLTDENPDLPGIQVTVPAGGSVNYQVVVTYPDNDNSATPRTDITVTIGVDSGNDGDTTPDATTVDIVRPPAMQFGDTTGTLGAVPTPTPVQVVDPNAADSTNPLDTTTTNDGTASFPMDVANTGAYNDTYLLSGTVPGLPGTTVTYYDASGNRLPAGPNGTFITPVVGAGQEIQVYAVVTGVADNTPTGDYTLNQTAVSNYSGITLTDTNNIIRVSPVGSVAIAKFVQGAPAPTSVNGIDADSGYGAGVSRVDPNAAINYQIKARNDFNTPIDAFFICDSVPANTVFGSIRDGDASANIYRVAGSTWSTTVPAAGLAAGTEVCISNDADGNLTPDTLPSGTTYTVFFSTTVN